MSTRRVRNGHPTSVRQTRSLFSAVSLMVLLVGAPLLLSFAHATLPVAALVKAGVHPGTWGRLLRSRLDDGGVVDVATSVAWMAWAWLAVCVAAEMLANLKGVPAGRLPGSRYVQPLATLLVSASLAVLPSAKPTSHLRLQAVEAASIRSVGHDTVSFSALAMDETESSAPEIPPNTYVVEPGDTLWSIAQRQLGSPLLWREIAELNMGRPQPDGETLTDAHWIFPGWVLLLPTSSPVPTPIPATTSARISDVESGSPAMTRRDVIGHSRFPIEPVGFGVLGASVVALIEKMRRAQQRHRGTGLRIKLPEGDLAGLEHRLRLGANHEATEWIDLAQRLISARAYAWSQLGPVSTNFPRVLAVRLRSDQLELLLDPSFAFDEPLAPFESGIQGTGWVLRRDSDTLRRLENDPSVTGADAALPSLVTLGQEANGLVLLDLERAGSVAVTGSQSDEVAYSMLLELATSKWSDQVDVIVVGLFDEIETLDRVSRAANIASIVERVERRLRERRALLEIVKRSTNSESRCVERGDAWDLCVVVCMKSASAAERDALEELISLSGDGTLGLAVVASSSDFLVEARTSVVADGGPLSFSTRAANPLESSRSPLWPQTLELGQLEGVTSLVKVAGDLEGVPSRISGPPESELLPAEQPPRSSDSTIEVRILGPVDVLGAARPFTRAWSLDLVVYLCVHRKGASTEMWATALWPDRVMVAASLHSTASAARRALGTTGSGEDHLPRSHGRLMLNSSVVTDWERFVVLSRSEDPSNWRTALELVRGRPFEGLRSADWALLEGISPLIEAEVVDLATRYAEHCMSSGDSLGAEFSARQGLHVSAYDERLYRVLMRAADLAGNPAGVEAVMAELVHLVAEDVEPVDAVHPETLDLYRSLSRRRITPAAS